MKNIAFIIATLVGIPHVWAGHVLDPANSPTRINMSGELQQIYGETEHNATPINPTNLAKEFEKPQNNLSAAEAAQP